MTRKPIPTRTEIVIDIAWILLRFIAGSIIYALLLPYFILMFILATLDWIINKIDAVSEYSGMLYPLEDTPLGYLMRAIKSTKVLFRYKHWVSKIKEDKE